MIDIPISTQLPLMAELNKLHSACDGLRRELNEVQLKLDQYRLILQSDTASPITPAQEQVLRCLLQGLVNRQIARQLGVAEGTVKTHISAMLSKIPECTNRTQLSCWGMKYFRARGEHL